ncbi:CBS domain-containing protein [Salipiger mucosus]|uniref:CBS domain-containing protein n=1 Tax=Salipiger mucosus DSM 16094 TaxID=1123237 RepID=S9QAN2_9RHOB|nr:CBS domain-containing protein [Salipiger mucosus]EPX76678.1 hypothetical protein Salmuc_00510 [Salipiger mucosus DSM 16094]
MTDAGTIEPYMRTEFLRLHPDTVIRRAIAELLASGESAAPVVDDSGHLVGIFTQKDCFAPALQSAYYQSWPDTVARFMTAEVRTLDAHCGLIAAAEIFHGEPFRAFPVTQGGSLVGMLSRADLLAAFIAFG